MNTQGAIAAIKAFRDATQGITVSPELVKSRIKVCNSCPMRKSNAGIVGRVSEIMGRLANKHRVPPEVSKYKCGVCSCNLSLLIPAVEPHKDSAEEAEKRPLTCWMKTD